MKSVVMPVSKNVNGKYVKQGEVAIVVPTLEDVMPFIGSKITAEEDGLPVYEADEANFVMSAILNYVKMNARNKLVSGTAEVKPGLKIPTNWAELCAEGERGGNGAALQLAREVRETFNKWLATTGKSQAAQAKIAGYFGNKQALLLANPGDKEKMAGYIEQFAAQLEEAELDRFARPLENITEACAAESASDW
jgi:hypothetical protein